MIIDYLDSLALYEKLSPGFAAAFRFLRECDFHALPAGRTNIDGDALYIMSQRYETKHVSEGKWEAHRTYADIQFIIEGEERIGYAPLRSMTVATPYTAENDYALYEGAGDFVRLATGQFGIYFPADAHMPGIAVDQPAPVFKAVVKVRL